MPRQDTDPKPARRRYTAEFKDELVQRSLQPGASVSAIALESRMNANVLFKWRREHLRALSRGAGPRRRTRDAAAGEAGSYRHYAEARSTALGFAAGRFPRTGRVRRRCGPVACWILNPLLQMRRSAIRMCGRPDAPATGIVIVLQQSGKAWRVEDGANGSQGTRIRARPWSTVGCPRSSRFAKRQETQVQRRY